MEDQKSRKLGPYQLLRRLARGGMSEVYVVLDERDAHLYALKMVRQQEEEDCRRLQQEVKVLMQLQHPHILPILDAAFHDEYCYYVMPYMEHGTLKDRLMDGPLHANEAETVLIQVAEALHFLHQAGFVHRDVKTSNILQDEHDSFWLADFGLVRAMEGGSDLTRTGYLLGTPAYMAPELEKKPANAQSDVYALGVVLYEMLTGQVPFTGETPLELYIQQVYEQPPLPSTINPFVSPAVEQVIMRALEKQPAKRYPSAQALADAYQEALQVEQANLRTERLLPVEGGGHALPPSVTISKQKQRRGRNVPLAVGAFVVMVVLTLSLVSIGALSQQDFLLLDSTPAHALVLPAGNGSSARTSTPVRTLSPSSTTPSGASAPTPPGNTPTPPPTTSPVTMPPTGGTTPTPVNTVGGPGNKGGKGNGNGNKGGKSKG